MTMMMVIVIIIIIIIIIIIMSLNLKREPNSLRRSYVGLDEMSKCLNKINKWLSLLLTS